MLCLFVPMGVLFLSSPFLYSHGRRIFKKFYSPTITRGTIDLEHECAGVIETNSSIKSPRQELQRQIVHDKQTLSRFGLSLHKRKDDSYLEKPLLS